MLSLVQADAEHGLSLSHSPSAGHGPHGATISIPWARDTTASHLPHAAGTETSPLGLGNIWGCPSLFPPPLLGDSLFHGTVPGEEEPVPPLLAFQFPHLSLLSPSICVIICGGLGNRKVSFARSTRSQHHLGKLGQKPRCRIAGRDDQGEEHAALLGRVPGDAS